MVSGDRCCPQVGSRVQDVSVVQCAHFSSEHDPPVRIALCTPPGIATKRVPQSLSLSSARFVTHKRCMLIVHTNARMPGCVPMLTTAHSQPCKPNNRRRKLSTRLLSECECRSFVSHPTTYHSRSGNGGDFFVFEQKSATNDDRPPRPPCRCAWGNAQLEM